MSMHSSTRGPKRALMALCSRPNLKAAGWLLRRATPHWRSRGRSVPRRNECRHAVEQTPQRASARPFPVQRP
eukprot:356781-Chlamydomonas_euryale.AAC.2